MYHCKNCEENYEGTPYSQTYGTTLVFCSESCEDSFYTEITKDTGWGDVDEEDDNSEVTIDLSEYPRCPEGNAYKYHTKPCSPACDYPGKKFL